MLVVFTNKSGATVEMFEKVALDLIKLMGRREAIPSAISTEDLPKALETLQAGLKQISGVDPEQNKQDDTDDDAPKPIGLSTRAYPLLELMQQTIQDQSFLMWDYR